MDFPTIRRLVQVIAFGMILLLGMFGYMLERVSPASREAAPSAANSSPLYERLEVWDLRGDDTVRFTVLDTYSEAAPKRMKWLGIPLIWKDADIAESAPVDCTLIEPRVEDRTYRGQSYRAHNYIVESDRRQFGYAVTFNVLPHIHITGAASRLLSIGVDPSNDAEHQTRSVIAVLLPEGAFDVAITDMQPYKTLTYNARTLYYYDVHPVTAHQSIHIAYTLAGTASTDIDPGTVIDFSNP